MKTIYPECTHGLINRVTDSIFKYQAWGTVARDENGTIYVVASGFRVGHVCPFGKTVMYISRNEGKTWTPPIVINDTYMDDRDAGILYLGNGRMLVTWFTHSSEVYLSNPINKDMLRDAGDLAHDVVAGMLNTYQHIPEEKRLAGSYIRISEDYGVTWSEAIRLPISAPHGPTLCRDGSLIYLGIEIYNDERTRYRQFPDGKECAALYRSTDGGRTWSRRSTLDEPSWLESGQHLYEPHVLELPDGRFLGAFRVDGIAPFTIGTAISEDAGQTWSEIVPTDVIGSPPHLMLHSSGALICSYGRRNFPCGERAMVSYDMGKTWAEEYILDAPKNENDGDLGYPSTVELSDGSLMTVYYQRYEDDLRTSLIYTKWRLNESKPTLAPLS